MSTRQPEPSPVVPELEPLDSSVELSLEELVELSSVPDDVLDDEVVDEEVDDDELVVSSIGSQ